VFITLYLENALLFLQCLYSNATMLNYPILTTKLNRPRCFQTFFQRPRLEDLLQKNIDKVATLIIAGAGYGKSTLVSEWLKDKKHVWLSCDANINKLEIFLSYLIHGFQKEDIHHFPETASLLSSSNEYSEELLLNTFFSEGDAISQKTIVAIDDFHLLDSPQILNLLNIYLNHPLQNIHLILLSRRDLSTGYSKHKLNQKLLEIRMLDLNLTQSELMRYAQTCFGLESSAALAYHILQLTEGWFLGVNQLLYSQGNINKPLEKKEMVAQTDQFNSYFAEEVITRQTDESQKVLFVASLFHQFSHELLGKILLSLDANFPVKEITTTLTNKNNFAIGLDNANSWYRFHHQFQEALEHYFTNHPFNEFRSICLTIGGEWLIENKYYEDGIIKLIEAGKHDVALKHLQCFRYELLNTDQYSRLSNILSIFPTDLQKSNIELILIKSFILENQGKHEALAELLNESSINGHSGTKSPQQSGEQKVMQALLLFFAGEYAECIRYVDQALELMSDYAESIITFAYAYKAMAVNALGQGDEALSILKTRLDAFHKEQHQSIVRTIIPISLIHAFHSNLKEIERIVPQAIEISEKHSYYETLGMGLYFQLEVSYRTGQHDQCSALFEKAHEIRYLIRPVWYAYILGLKVFFYLQSKGEQLTGALNELDVFCKEQKAENILQLQKAIRIELAMANKDFAEAKMLQNDTNFHLYPPIFYFYLPQITELKVLLFANEGSDYKDFNTASAPLWAYAEAQSHKNLLIKLNILSSIAHFRQNKKEDAREKMKHALDISQITGDTIVYTEFGHDVYEIINLVSKSDASSDHIKHVLSLFNVYPAKKAINGFSFKERDLNILNFVSMGYSNAQIADTMFLSPESVKKYLYDIFQALEVKSRMKAVIKAKEIGVIQ
jgi:LuxR family maltose regulon positive regulatory protein